MKEVTANQIQNALDLNEAFDRRAARKGIDYARAWVHAKLAKSPFYVLLGRLRFTEIYDNLGEFDTEAEAWAEAERKGGAAHYIVEPRNVDTYPSR